MYLNGFYMYVWIHTMQRNVGHIYTLTRVFPTQRDLDMVDAQVRVVDGFSRYISRISKWFSWLTIMNHYEPLLTIINHY